jgi:endonuclease/exonuclease/phosphatase family metal-dependent hydrolase
MAELQMIRDIASKEYEKGNYVVVGGDWNQNPPGWKGHFGYDYKSKVAWPIPDEYFPTDWSWVYDPSVPTNRDVTGPFGKTITKTTILDYFLISPNLEVLEIHTLDLGFEFSDHHPVKVSLKLK